MAKLAANGNLGHLDQQLDRPLHSTQVIEQELLGTPDTLVTSASYE